MKGIEMDFGAGVQAGSDHFAYIMREAKSTDNLPILLQTFLEVGKDRSGFSEGFFCAAASELLK